MITVGWGEYEMNLRTSTVDIGYMFIKSVLELIVGLYQSASPIYTVLYYNPRSIVCMLIFGWTKLCTVYPIFTVMSIALAELQALC